MGPDGAMICDSICDSLDDDPLMTDKDVFCRCDFCFSPPEKWCSI